MYIGDIYLPILSSIDKKSVSKITKEIAGINISDPKSVSIRRNLQPVTLEGYLYNDGEKDDAQYAEDVEALQYRSAGYCYTQYADLDGFIEIDNADAPQTSEELGVRNYSVEGKYLPATKYERVVEVETEMRENEFNIEFPPHVALPIGATNVRVKTSQDSVKLSAPAFTAGNIPIYRPFPAFYPDDVTHSKSDAPQCDATAYKLTYNLLDAKDESISYTMVSGIDIPLGTYRVVLRMKSDATIASDVRIVVLSGDNVVVDDLYTFEGDNEETTNLNDGKWAFTINESLHDLISTITSLDNTVNLRATTLFEDSSQSRTLITVGNQPINGEWTIVKTKPFNITQKGLTYTIKVQKETDDLSNIAINYGFLLPEKRARVAFDVGGEYNVGECKVFDTITTGSEESEWKQVFNPEHDFVGDIVVQNPIMRWVIKQTTWKNAKLYSITNNNVIEVGSFYNKAFGDNRVIIKFKEIKPNYLKFTFELDTGNATSRSTSAKEYDTVEVTPFNFIIKKDIIGNFRNHYTIETDSKSIMEKDNGVIVLFEPTFVGGLIKSHDFVSGINNGIIETTKNVTGNSYVIPFVIPLEDNNTINSQDLAFLSAVYSSQKCKVEVK